MFITATLLDAITDFVKHVNTINDAHYAKSFPTLDKPRFVADPLSDKWIRINRQELRDGVYKTVSVYCFVCLQDYATKALGSLKAGDLHKAAGFKMPAKHARGSVMNPDGWACANPYGLEYLAPGRKAV